MISLLGAVLALQTVAPLPARAQSVPSGLPSHFAFGVAAGQGDRWPTDTGGAGNSGNTITGDAKKDGVTNPPAICTTDGISTGQICNDHLSTVADDDGGFIRMMGQAYYQNPVALRGAPAAAPVRPVPVVPAPQLRVDLGQAVVEPLSANSGEEVTFRQDVSVSTAATLID
jgi:hypothetical protein